MNNSYSVKKKKFRLDSAFKDACTKGDLTQVKNLIKSNNDNIDYDLGLIFASTYGHLDIVKYLLTSSELEKHANINTQDDYPLRIASSNLHIDVIKYLLTSPELKKHADIHARNDEVFYTICALRDYNMLKYLIIDFGIRKNEKITPFIEADEEINNMFKLRELNESLRDSLIENKFSGKKNKL
jgi:ankyrin repeat protein